MQLPVVIWIGNLNSHLIDLLKCTDLLIISLPSANKRQVLQKPIASLLIYLQTSNPPPPSSAIPRHIKDDRVLHSSVSRKASLWNPNLAGIPGYKRGKKQMTLKQNWRRKKNPAWPARSRNYLSPLRRHYPGRVYYILFGKDALSQREKMKPIFLSFFFFFFGMLQFYFFLFFRI